MLKQYLFLAFATVLLPATPAVCQTPAVPADIHSDATRVSLPIFSSDGMEIGRIVDEIVLDTGETLTIAEIEQRLGFGPATVIISTDKLRFMPDRVTLTVTADEVENVIREPEDK